MKCEPSGALDIGRLPAETASCWPRAPAAPELALELPGRARADSEPRRGIGGLEGPSSAVAPMLRRLVGTPPMLPRRWPTAGRAVSALGAWPPLAAGAAARATAGELVKELAGDGSSTA